MHKAIYLYLPTLPILGQASTYLPFNIRNIRQNAEFYTNRYERGTTRKISLL